MEIFTIRNVKKNLFSWENQVSIYRQGQVETWPHLRGLLEASSPRNLEFSNNMAISHELQQFRMFVRSQKCINTNFHLFGAFCMTVRNFRMVMRNQLLNFPLSCSQNWLLVHFAWLCEIFAWLCEMEIHNSSTLFAIFSISFSWFHSNYLQINSKFRSKPIALLLSLCIWIIINFICSFQFDSSIFSPIYQNHTLKWLQNFIKLVSNSYKGNMLIECFMHIYYSKDVKFMRIII